MFDYRILRSSISKYRIAEKIVMFQYYMDVILEAIKENDLTTLNDKRLLAIFNMIHEYDFLLDLDF